MRQKPGLFEKRLKITNSYKNYSGKNILQVMKTYEGVKINQDIIAFALNLLIFNNIFNIIPSCKKSKNIPLFWIYINLKLSPLHKYRMKGLICNFYESPFHLLL